MPDEPSTTSHKDAASSRDVAAVAVLLVLLMPWWIALLCPFIHIDDPLYVTRNQHVLTGLSFENIRWAFTTTHGAFYFPMTWLSLMLDASLMGTGPVGFHATNVILHVANALLLYALLRVAGAGRGSVVLPLAATLCWSLHPLRVESVAWVTERKDVLSLFFGLLAMLAYVRYTRTPSFRGSLGWYAVALLLLLLSLMAKSILVTLPVLLLCLDCWPLRRQTSWHRLVIEKLPMLGAALACAVSTLVIARRSAAVTDFQDYPLGSRVANALDSCMLYLRDTFSFGDLSIYYPGMRSPGLGPTLGAAIALSMIAGGAWYLWRLRPELGRAVVSGLVWFLVALLPVLGIVQSGLQSRADRFTYVPAIGLSYALCALALFGIEQLRGNNRRLIAWGLSLGGAALLFVGTTMRLQLWRDPLALYLDGVARTDRNGWLETFVALALEDQERTAEAERWYRQSIRDDPTTFEAYLNYGSLLARQGRWEEASQAFDVAVHFRPNDPLVRDRYESILAHLHAAQSAATRTSATRP